MKLLKYFLLILFFVSCKKNNLELYFYEPKDDDSVIRGYELQRFFEAEQGVVKHEIPLIDGVENELNKLMNHMNIEGNEDKGLGIYYYSIIYERDTLYFSSDFLSWKYKNRVGIYKNELIIKFLNEKLK